MIECLHIMACVKKETFCTHKVKCERRKNKEFGIPETWGKKLNMRGKYNVCRYNIFRKIGT